MSVKVELSCEQLSRVEKLLHGIPGGIETAESNAFNRGLAAGKTEANKQIRQRYAISSGMVSRFEKVTLRRSSGGGDAAIEFSGTKIPAFKFKPSPAARTYTGKRIPVVIRGEGQDAVWRLVFKNSAVKAMDIKETGYHTGSKWFIANFKSGNTGVFKRTGKTTSGNKTEIREIWGQSVADMLDYKPAKEAVAERVQEVVNQRLEHEIGRILSRY